MNNILYKLTILILALLWLSSMAIANVIINGNRSYDQKNPCMLKLDDGNIAFTYYSGDEIMGATFLYRLFTPELEPLYSTEYQLEYIFNNCYNVDGITISDYIFWAYTANVQYYDTTTNVYIRKYSYLGNGITELIRVNDDLDSTFFLERLIHDEPNERIIVAYYRSPWLMHGTRDYFIRHYDYDLNPLTEPIEVFSYSSEALTYNLDISKLSSDKLIMAINTKPEYTQGEIRAKYFDYYGNNQSELFLVNDSTLTYYFSPNVAQYDGGALITWAGHDYDRMMIQGKRIDLTGQFIDSDNIVLSYVNAVGDGLYQTPNAAFNFDSQMFAIAWSHSTGSQGLESFVRFFNQDLTPTTDTIRTQFSDWRTLSFPKCLFTNDTEVIVCSYEWFGSDLQYDVVGSLVDSYTGIDESASLLPVFNITAYPNPFNSTVKFSINSPLSNDGELNIYDVTGRLVKQIEFESSNEIYWDGTSNAGNDVTSGIYFARFTDLDKSYSTKVVLLR